MGAPKGNKFAEGEITGDKLIKGSFRSEKKMEDYIENNIENIFNLITDEDYSSHVRQYRINQTVYGRGAGMKVDIMVDSKRGNKYFWELKCARNYTGILNGLMQLLYYKESFKYLYDKEAELVLISDKFDGIVGKIIEKYNFPIKFIVIDNQGGVFELKQYGNRKTKDGSR
jgi:hypothetical protein